METLPAPMAKSMVAQIDEDPPPPSAATQSMVSEAELLEMSGENEVCHIREVALRERGLLQVPPHLLAAVDLEVLSLSHNRLQSAESLRAFRGLQYVNLNFNALTSIDGLEQCKELRQVFLANNRVRDLTPLASCQKLTVLSVFQNSVASLDAALFVLRSLPALHKLDFEGNPCTAMKAYRHQMLLHLPGVTELDGEEVTTLDRDVARGYAETEQVQAVFNPRKSSALEPAALASTMPQAAPLPRAPYPAPLLPSALPLPSPGWGGETPRGFVPPSPEKAAARPFTAPSLMTFPATDVSLADDRLFGCDFLNEHPLIMEYLANEEFPNPEEAAGPKAQAAPSRGQRPPSFASRLRATTATMNASASLSVSQLAELEQQAAPQGYRIEEAVLHMPADNPQQMLRRLVRVCELLRRQRDAAVEGERRAMATLDEVASRSQGTGCAPAASGRDCLPAGKVPLTMREAEELAKTTELLVRENKQLRMENKNMYHVMEENKDLRAEVQNFRFRTEELKKINNGMREAKVASLGTSHAGQTTARPHHLSDRASVLVDTEHVQTDGLSAGLAEQPKTETTAERLKRFSGRKIAAGVGTMPGPSLDSGTVYKAKIASGTNSHLRGVARPAPSATILKG